MFVVADIMVLDACQFRPCFLKWLRMCDMLVLCIGLCGFGGLMYSRHQFINLLDGTSSSICWIDQCNFKIGPFILLCNEPNCSLTFRYRASYI